MPLHCAAAGKAVLAFLPEKERAKIISEQDFYPYTPQTITDPDELEMNLREIYRTGVSYNYQEFHNGINALATPIFNSQNRAIGSLAVVGTSVDLDKKQLDEYAEMFIEASIDVSNKLGAEFPQWILDYYKR